MKKILFFLILISSISLAQNSRFEVNTDFISKTEICSLILVSILETDEDGTRFLRAQGVFVNQECYDLELHSDLSQYVPENSIECSLTKLVDLGVIRGFQYSLSNSVDGICFNELAVYEDIAILIEKSIKKLLTE